MARSEISISSGIVYRDLQVGAVVRSSRELEKSY
jgi:hypothetical protein